MAKLTWCIKQKLCTTRNVARAAATVKHDDASSAKWRPIFPQVLALSVQTIKTVRAARSLRTGKGSGILAWIAERMQRLDVDASTAGEQTTSYRTAGVS